MLQANHACPFPGLPSQPLHLHAVERSSLSAFLKHFDLHSDFCLLVLRSVFNEKPFPIFVSLLSFSLGDKSFKISQSLFLVLCRVSAKSGYALQYVLKREVILFALLVLLSSQCQTLLCISESVNQTTVAIPSTFGAFIYYRGALDVKHNTFVRKFKT